MKNLLSLLAALGLTATAATTVIACGSPKNSIVIKKTTLKDLHLKTRLKSSVKNQQAAFDLFVEMNPEVSDLRDAVQITSFTAPDYNNEGSLEVQAKTNTNYSGTLTITIPELIKTDIARLLTNTTIQGTENMNEVDAFNAFLEANSSWTNLNDYVETDSFTAPTYTSNGSLSINPKPNGQYTGSIIIVITAIGQKSLDSLHLHTTLSIPVTNQQAAFDSFISLNSEVSDLRDNLEITSFTAPDSNQTGTLMVTSKADTKYSGTLTITIPVLNKTDIAHLVTNTTIQGTENMSEEQAFTSFLAANSSWTNLNDYVEVSDFKSPDYITPGSLTIAVKSNTEYTGSVLITITAIGQKSLDSLHLHTTLSIPVTNQQAAFDSFISLNSEVSDLRDNLEITGFTAPDSNQTGILIVTSKADTKYSGTLTITIPALNKTDIARLLTNTTIQGNKLMSKADAFQAFLTANSSWEGLDTVVDADSYQPPSDEDGYLIVNAKANTQFTGSVKIVVKKYLVDKENIASTFYDLGVLGWYNFDVTVNTKVQDLVSILNQRIKQLYLDNYGAFADNIADINTVNAREYPSQEQLNTVGTVWKPSRFNMNGQNWSALRLTIRIDYKDGSSENVIVYDVECSITVVAAQ